jgi:hypothetical protein
MAELIKLFRKNKLTFGEFSDCKKGREIVSEYINSGKHITGHIHKILFSEFESCYIYSILIENGYIFDNNYMLATYIFDIYDRLPDKFVSLKEEDRCLWDTRITLLIKLLDNIEIRKYLEAPQLNIIITDTDVEKICKYCSETINFIIHLLLFNEFIYKNDNIKMIKEYKITIPKIVWNLKKYKDEYNKVYNLILEKGPHIF